MSDKSLSDIDHEGWAESFAESGLEKHADAFRLLSEAKECIEDDDLEQAEKLIDTAKEIARSLRAGTEQEGGQ